VRGQGAGCKQGQHCLVQHFGAVIVLQALSALRVAAVVQCRPAMASTAGLTAASTTHRLSCRHSRGGRPRVRRRCRWHPMKCPQRCPALAAKAVNEQLCSVAGCKEPASMEEMPTKMPCRAANEMQHVMELQLHRHHSMHHATARILQQALCQHLCTGTMPAAYTCCSSWLTCSHLVARIALAGLQRLLAGYLQAVPWKCNSCEMQHQEMQQQQQLRNGMLCRSIRRNRNRHPTHRDDLIQQGSVQNRGHESRAHALKKDRRGRRRSLS